MSMTCPNCNAECADDDRFCWSCGNALRQGAWHSASGASDAAEREQDFIPLVFERVPSPGDSGKWAGLRMGLLGAGVVLMLAVAAWAAVEIVREGGSSDAGSSDDFPVSAPAAIGSPSSPVAPAVASPEGLSSPTPPVTVAVATPDVRSSPSEDVTGAVPTPQAGSRPGSIAAAAADPPESLTRAVSFPARSSSVTLLQDAFAVSALQEEIPPPEVSIPSLLAEQAESFDVTVLATAPTTVAPTSEGIRGDGTGGASGDPD